jgi:hypothetical protein
VQCCPQLKDAGSTGKTLNNRKAVIETMNKRKIIKVKRRTINLAII